METSPTKALLMPGNWLAIVALTAVGLVVLAYGASATSGQDCQVRVSGDVAQGRVIVVHVVVALCDNQHQGIVPVPQHLGNGQDARSNLYWGALYGVKTFLSRQGGWRIVASPRPADERILERIVLFDRLRRDGSSVPVYIVADAWDGSEMRAAVQAFLAFAGGLGAETVSVKNGTETIEIAAGGAAHLIGFVGHNGLMDFSLSEPARRADARMPSSSLVLACASRPYFLDLLQSAGSHPLLLTTGLMAPEAYTLDAAVRSWVESGSVAAVCEAAAQTYARYQRCGIRGARNLFWGASP